MPRTEAGNERARENARNRILAGARTAFARKGMAATMTDVAAAAGVSQGLPYRYFDGKEELVRAVVAEATQRAGTDGAPIAVPDSAAERLRRMVATLVDARRSQPELFLLFEHVVSDSATPPDLLEAIRARGDAVAQTMRRLVVEAQADGDVAADDARQLVFAVMACLDGLGRFAMRSPTGPGEGFPTPEIILRMLQPASANLPTAGGHGPGPAR